MLVLCPVPEFSQWQEGDRRLSQSTILRQRRPRPQSDAVEESSDDGSVVSSASTSGSRNDDGLASFLTRVCFLGVALWLRQKKLLLSSEFIFQFLIIRYFQ
jgi:hypothetical protein